MSRFHLSALALASLLALVVLAGCEGTPESDAAQMAANEGAMAEASSCPGSEAACETSCDGCPAMDGKKVEAEPAQHQCGYAAEACEYATADGKCPADCPHHSTSEGECVCTDSGGEAIECAYHTADRTDAVKTDAGVAGATEVPPCAKSDGCPKTCPGAQGT